MASRGRGRGRGGYGRGFAKPVPVVLFPDIALPPKGILVKQPNGNYTTEEKVLVQYSSKLQKFWESSPYYIEAPSEKKGQTVDIERYSDRLKPKHNLKREGLDVYMKCSSFPFELHDVLLGKRGSKLREPQSKKPRWIGLEKQLDMFEKLEQEVKSQKASAKPKNDEDDDEAEDEEGEGEDEEESDEGEYDQNEYCDDDEDDYNIAEPEEEHEL